MIDVASFFVPRTPDLSLSVAAASKGWSLAPAAETAAAMTSSAAGLLLSPAQLAAIAPLAALASGADGAIARPAFDPVFDPVYETMHQAFLGRDAGRIDAIAAACLERNPVAPMGQASGIEQSVYRFFTFKGAKSTPAEKLALFSSFGEEATARHLAGAARRIDTAKAQALALAVRGELGTQNSDLIGGLRAELGFCVLAACIEFARQAGGREDVPLKYVDLVVGMRAYRPGWTFQIDPCKWRRQNLSKPVPSRLSARLAAEHGYDAALDQRAELAAAAARGVGSVSEADCDCDSSDAPCQPADPCCGEITYYMTDLLTLREETSCYKASDLAYIENVAPYETRIRRHTGVKTVEDYSEDAATQTEQSSRDQQVTERFSLQKEVNQNLKQSLDVDAEISGKVYGQDYKLHTSASLSKDVSRREAREQFREAVNKASQSLQIETRKLRTRRVTTQTTESNKHKFANTTALPAVAKYFWVSQEKKAQVFSHGLRTMVDILVPSPAKLYEHLEALKAARGFTKVKPVAPPELNLSAKQVTRDNYVALAAQYGIADYADPPAQPPTLYASATVSRGTTSAQVDIPSGYTATRLDRTSSILHRSVPGFFARISLIFGTQMVSHTTDSNTDSATINQRSSGSATLSEKNASKDSSITARITLEADTVDIAAWRSDFYQAIVSKHEAAIAAYQAALREYEDALEAYNRARAEEIRGRHPFAAEEIIRAELKRAAIYMMCEDFHPNTAMNPRTPPCGYPEINRRAASEATKDWYFFDRGFDWKLASFVFFDYFRNPICNWPETFDPDETNFLFKAFRRAGYARIQVPVSPGMAEDVVEFLNSHQPWGHHTGPATNPDDPRWISVVEEIRHSHGCYQNDREGHIQAYLDPVTQSFDHRVVMHTDLYWDAFTGTIDQTAINLDLDREIFIDGIAYRILSIAPDPASPAYSGIPGTLMQWIIELERKFAGQAYIDPTASTLVLKPYNYAIGAQYVGSPFYFELPTDLVWIGDHTNVCLPCYPLASCMSETALAAAAEDVEAAEDIDGL